jgi:glyoxylase I family protein
MSEAVLCCVGLPELYLAPDRLSEAHMHKVLGIGGFFFRSRDPKALARWYEAHLGIAPVPDDYSGESWAQQSGTTVFAPVSAATESFGRPEQQWMINFRVADLDAMAAQLEAAGISVTIDPETYPNGRFARFCDPEGNPIELWQEELLS